MRSASFFGGGKAACRARASSIEAWTAVTSVWDAGDSEGSAAATAAASKSIDSMWRAFGS
jgi:hypothetical protein